MLRAHHARRAARLLGAAVAAGALSTTLLVSAPLGAEASAPVTGRYVALTANGVKVRPAANGVSTRTRTALADVGARRYDSKGRANGI
jgi:hypothetical protein